MVRPNRERNDQIFHRYASGESQHKLAVEFGITQQRVSEIITAIRAKIGHGMESGELRKRYLEQLEALRADAQALVDAEPAPLFRGTERVVTVDPETGAERQYEDHAGRMTAMGMVLKVQERTAKMLGLDAAEKVEHSGSATVRYIVEGVDPEAMT